MNPREDDIEHLLAALGRALRRKYGQVAEEFEVRFRGGRRFVAPPPEPTEEKAPDPACETYPISSNHSPDFRSLNWFGEEYFFTEPQARVIQVLWDAWVKGTRDIGDRLLVQASGSSSTRLADVFRDSPAWGKLIVEGATRGTHRLGEPASAQ